MSAVRIEKIKPHIGGLVHVAKEHLFYEENVAALREALEDRGVLVFPRMNLTDSEQLKFTDKLGTRLNYHRKAPGSGADGEEDVYTITLDKKVNFQPEYVLGTFFWHIDGVTINQPLPKATLLSARKLSPKGGQTEFASTYAAYENLPEAEKEELQRFKVIHKMEASMRPVFEALAGLPAARMKTGWADIVSEFCA